MAHCSFDMIPGCTVDDFLISLRSREQAVPLFKLQSPQLEHRPKIVAWIVNVSEHFELQKKTIHLAMALADIFMDFYQVSEDQFYLLAIGCIQVSAKFEEIEVNIPRPDDIMHYTGQPYTNRLCMKMELYILQHCKWEIGIPTVVHFCDCYMLELIQTTDMVNNVPISEKLIPTAVELCNDHRIFLQNIVLNDPSYRKHRPSLVSAAILAVARGVTNICPPWPSRMATLTQCSMEDIKPFCTIFQRCYDTSQELPKQHSAKGLGTPQKFTESATPPHSPASSMISYSSGYNSNMCTPSPPDQPEYSSTQSVPPSPQGTTVSCV